MKFVENIQFPVLVCPLCHGVSSSLKKRCRACNGMRMGIEYGSEWVYFNKPLTSYDIELNKGQKKLNSIEVLVALLLGGMSFVVFAILLTVEGTVDFFLTADFWNGTYGFAPAFLIIGGIFFIYSAYRKIHFAKNPKEVERKKYNDTSLYHPTPYVGSWEDVKKTFKKRRKNIADFFTPEVHTVFERAYEIAHQFNNAYVTSLHVFAALLEQRKVNTLFLRLGIPTKSLIVELQEIFQAKDFPSKTPDNLSLVSDEVKNIIFAAYDETVNAKQRFLDVTEVLLVTIRQSHVLQDALYDYEMDYPKLVNVILWARVQEWLRQKYSHMQKAALHRSKHGIDRAMTAVATPYLNNFSEDLSLAAMKGYLPPCVAREKEIEEVFRVIDSGQPGAILVGERGVGKMTIVDGIAELMIEGLVPERLYDKRLVLLSTSSLLAGTTISGAQERLIRIMNEVARAQNIILVINNLHDLMSGRGAGGFDVSESLAEFMGRGNYVVIATATSEGYNRAILNSQIGKLMRRIDVKELSDDGAVQALESKVSSVEYKHNVFFSYDALAAAVSLSRRFLRDQLLPASAIDLMNESASFVQRTKGKRVIVSRDDVAEIVHEKTGVPVTSLTDQESQKLLALEQEMHQRVIGQDEAVRMVASALRRARAEIRSTNRPIANFLFLGPTGVGKTELAKTIASVYFGGENRMIRIDMSEFQDRSGIYRLIGQPGVQGSGMLTEAVRQKPFSLILLDEMEKAAPQILDLFLQVFDDGRLTDSVGRVIDFSNTIIIATSNAGTANIQEKIRQGISVEAIQDALMRGELKQYFRPEFLNRFDGIVVFKPLDKGAIEQIASLMLKRVGKDLEAKGIEFEVGPSGIELLAEIGFDPEFGARPMRRAIQERVENQLADMFLSGKVVRRDHVIFDRNGLRVTNRNY